MRSYFNFQAFENCGYIFSERSCLLFLLNMLSEIAFEEIEGNYWYGAYGEFRVIMMKDNGYINATKMCSSGGKEYFRWRRLQSSAELIQALERNMALENTQVTSASTLEDANHQIWRLASPPCIFVKTDNNTPTDQLKSGTYCHPVLIPHIACWVSVDFALKVSKVVNGYIAQEYKSKVGALELQLDQATELCEAATQDAHHAHLLRDNAILVAHQANQQIH